MVNNSELFPVHTRLCIILPAASEGHFFHGFFKVQKIVCHTVFCFDKQNYLQILLCSPSVLYTFCFSCLIASAFIPQLPPLQCRSVPRLKKKKKGGRRLGGAQRRGLVGNNLMQKVDRKLSLVIQ